MTLRTLSFSGRFNRLLFLDLFSCSINIRRHVTVFLGRGPRDVRLGTLPVRAGRTGPRLPSVVRKGLGGVVSSPRFGCTSMGSMDKRVQSRICRPTSVRSFFCSGKGLQKLSLVWTSRDFDAVLIPDHDTLRMPTLDIPLGRQSQVVPSSCLGILVTCHSSYLGEDFPSVDRSG